MPALETPDVAEIAKRIWARYHRQVNPEVLRVLAVTSAAGLLSVIVLWIAVHRFPMFGTWLVNGVRKVVGPKPIAWESSGSGGAHGTGGSNHWHWVEWNPGANGLCYPIRRDGRSPPAGALVLPGVY